MNTTTSILDYSVSEAEHWCIEGGGGVKGALATPPPKKKKIS